MLPTDLLIEILLRTDAPTIGRSRCVSHEWNQILRSEAFLNKHHKLCSAVQPSFLLHVWYFEWGGASNAFFRLCPNTDEEKNLKILIWNVLTGKKRVIPGPPNDGLQLYSSEDQKWSRTKGCAGEFYKLSPRIIALNGEVYWINYSATNENLPELIICYSVVSKSRPITPARRHERSHHVYCKLKGNDQRDIVMER
ncbi:hypothetical protein PIB30_008336 [Stylosanthes scabra]|uniref:F-box domain-containing protein n=1 Tax=Stylosanthes scabra TaxID=79078 RepID=A0ABU6T4R9_9FABA|nr:hypothetical protein [Stylosanthes scabra]